MMYKRVVRPVLFLFSPERIHHFIVFLLRARFFIPFSSFFIRKIFEIRSPKLERTVFGITFKNPVGFAAGFDKNAQVYNELANFGFSHIEIGTVTPKAQEGNPKPRLFRLKEDRGLINRMGFNNQGAEKIAANLKKRKHKIMVGGNIGKNTLTPNEDAVADYIYCYEALYDFVDYFAVNVSCPNIADLSKLQDKEQLRKILKSIKEHNSIKAKPKPILLKIAPDLSNNQLDDIIDLVISLKIDGVIATNTTTARDKLKSSPTLIERIGKGGLSGRPLRDRSTEVIRYLSMNSGNAFPIIGVGGIHSVLDAMDKFAAGATLVQVYTGFIYKGPFIIKNINKALLEIS
jgi:dihydroorotate dehydrogenase